MDINKPLSRCDSCHRDVHGGQFAKRVNVAGCADCHSEGDFGKVHFDHATEAAFPLPGAHAQVACSDCHLAPETGKKITIYAAAPRNCAGCHADIHLGQFGANTCDKCHTTAQFDDLRLNHDDPNFTRYPLLGAHNAVPCDDCHPVIRVGKSKQARVYLPLRQICEACHEDFHHGAFAALSGAANAETANGIEPCAQCHNVQGWLPATFVAHDETDFPLWGAHRATPCIACHARFF